MSYRYTKQLRSDASALLRSVEGMLDPERSSFAAFDPAKDAEVREAIRIYVQSWVIPPAKRLHEELMRAREDKQ